MSVHLLQLSPQQLRALCVGAVADDLPPASPGAIPPPFVLARALAAIEAGQPPCWWLPLLVIHDGRAVGGCALKGPPVAGRVEVLYGIAPAHRRRGLAVGALRGLIDHAFAAGAGEVMAEIEPGNLGSIRTAERCGMEALGTVTAHDGVTVMRYLARRGATVVD